MGFNIMYSKTAAKMQRRGRKKLLNRKKTGKTERKIIKL